MSTKTAPRATKPVNLKPAGSILIVEIEKDRRTAGGLVLPDKTTGEIERAMVVAVGPGKWDHGVFVEPQFHVGDVVIYQQHFGRYEPDQVDGRWLKFIDANNVMATEGRADE